MLLVGTVLEEAGHTSAVEVVDHTFVVEEAVDTVVVDIQVGAFVAEDTVASTAQSSAASSSTVALHFVEEPWHWPAYQHYATASKPVAGPIVVVASCSFSLIRDLLMAYLNTLAVAVALLEKLTVLLLVLMLHHLLKT